MKTQTLIFSNQFSIKYTNFQEWKANFEERKANFEEWKGMEKNRVEVYSLLFYPKDSPPPLKRVCSFLRNKYIGKIGWFKRKVYFNVKLSKYKAFLQ